MFTDVFTLVHEIIRKLFIYISQDHVNSMKRGKDTTQVYSVVDNNHKCMNSK